MGFGSLRVQLWMGDCEGMFLASCLLPLGPAGWSFLGMAGASEQFSVVLRF